MRVQLSLSPPSIPRTSGTTVIVMDLLYAIALHRLLKVGFFVQSEVEMGSIQGISYKGSIAVVCRRVFFRAAVVCVHCIFNFDSNNVSG